MKIAYRRDIDGLRAIAVISVVLFHAQLSFLPGGFVGVDIFFVISGYLITAIVMKHKGSFGNFFATFYERRIRRLFPPMIPVLVFSSVCAYVALDAEEFSEYGQSLVAALSFVSNWFFGTLSGYFDSAAETKPLLHTWSLSVEEQFYLIFPFIILSLSKFRRAFIIAFFSLLVLASFAYGNHLMSSGDLEWGFYSSPARFWEIGIGGLLAAIGLPQLKNVIVKNILGLIGICLIGYALFGLTADSFFPGYNALMPTVGTAMIIVANGGIVGRLLSLAPMVKIGLISYALYLWHWPIFVFLHYFWPAPSQVQMLCGVAVAIGLSFLSYYYVEQPVRSRRVFSSRRNIYTTFAILTLLIGAFGAFVRINDGLPNRIPKAVAEYKYHLTKQKHQFVIDSERDGCWLKDKMDMTSSIKRCTIKNPDKPNVLVFGDSHSAHLMVGLRSAFPEAHFNQLSGNSCTMVSGDTTSNRKSCRAIFEWTHDQTNLQGYDAIIMSTRGNSYSLNRLSKWAIEVSETFLGEVYMFGPAPFYAPNMPALYPRLIGKSDDNIDLAFDRALQTDRIELDELVRNNLRNTDVKFISLYEVLCNRDPAECQHLDINGKPILVDNSHLSSQASIELMNRLKTAGLMNFK